MMILGMMKYHLLLFLRDPLLLAFGFALPFVQLFLASEMGDSSYNFIDVSLPLFISIVVMSLCLLDSAYNHAHAREVKFLRRLRMTPVKPVIYLMSGYLFRMGVMTAFIGSFISVASIIFDLNLSGVNWGGFALMLWLSFTMFYVMGMFIGNVFRVGKTAQGALLVVFFSFIFVINIIGSLEYLPVLIQRIIENLPVVYVVNVLQSAWLGTDLFAGHSLMVVMGLTVIFGLLSVKFFKYE